MQAKRPPEGKPFQDDFQFEFKAEIPFGEPHSFLNP